MAKNTHAQEVMTGTPDSYTEHELTDPDPVVHREMLGGDPKLVEAGTPSLESSKSEQTSNDKTNPSPQSPAQPTENPSKDTETAEDSTVDTTAGDGRKTVPRQSTKSTTRKPQTRSRVIDEFD